MELNKVASTNLTAIKKLIYDKDLDIVVENIKKALKQEKEDIA